MEIIDVCSTQKFNTSRYDLNRCLVNMIHQIYLPIEKIICHVGQYIGCVYCTTSYAGQARLIVTIEDLVGKFEL